MKTNDVIGLGSALMDFLIEVDDDKLIEFDLKKGEMHLVEEEKAKEILNKIEEQKLNVENAPGGSSANTLRGITLLGGSAVLCAKVGNDEHGENYVQQMKGHGVTTRINKHHKTTGHCVSFITPDTERTMSTYLGASLELYKEDILEEDIAKSKVLHLEGYQLEGSTKETVLHAIELAKKHQTLISIDLADPGVVRRNKDLFKEILNDVNIVFVNEKEAQEFTGLENEDAALKLAKSCEIAIVKVGEKGSFICSNNEINKIEVVKAKAIDTTGAGDSYAAGFLYGYCHDWNLADSGKLGSLLAAKVVEQKGVGLKGINGKELILIVKKNKDEIKGVKKMIKIGIIGGSGLDNPSILEEVEEIKINTAYGQPSSHLKVGKINGVEVVLIARHGHQHTIPPSQVNFRANIEALKQQGCTHILATTACGSLRKEIERGDFVILDQFIDFTRHRKITFHEQFAPGNSVHTAMATPFHKELRDVLIDTCVQLGLRHHSVGTVITIEGPRFSTKAESKMFSSWGADVINMSIAPEAILAREAGIPYAAVAMSTDYDCLFDDVPPVTWKEILKVFAENVDKITKLLITAIPKINSEEISEEEEEEFDLKSTIRTVANWPKPGVMFRDITTLLENPAAFSYAMQKFKEQYQGKKIDKIAGIESRGFIFGAVLARELGLPFVLIRKKGKLPHETVAQEYSLEYGTDSIEIHKSSINPGDNVLIIDDLLATAGTMIAACKLVEKLEGKVMGVAFVIDLPDLGGMEKLAGYEVFKLIEFLGE